MALHHSLAEIENLIANAKTREGSLRLLRALRAGKCRQSGVVVEYGLPLIALETRGNDGFLGDELYPIIELVFIACLDVGQLSSARLCLDRLESKFPESGRVKGLKGMMLEAEKKYPEARKLYEEILKTNPVDPHAKKRLVCIHKALGEYPKAISGLNEYLKVFMNDVDAWQELAECYLHIHMFKSAAFCYEELILSVPNNPIYALKYASILFTLGDIDSLLLARKYFCFAHELNPENKRALLGICQTAAAISLIFTTSDRKLTPIKKSDEDLNEKIYKFAKAKIGKSFFVPPLQSAKAK